MRVGLQWYPLIHLPGILDAEAERGCKKSTEIESKPHEETGIKCFADREHENRPSWIQRVWAGIATRFSTPGTTNWRSHLSRENSDMRCGAIQPESVETVRIE
ncbi:hypothetical protein PISMIDRAFT_672586 [Pisolithus microcarpus 441]|uniref:Uncharacterized protein n=1 Tax=Pisolithus microcarpus 441 TaxID=765257 RepID=A0A0D0AAY2_9AGAM|nr:hypothetical protein PISMIDRAFT_672586 [Pisolithus microcarpus 441]